MERSLGGRIALVTGGAGGIGAAICRDLAARGVRVIVADVDEPSAKRVATELPDAVAAGVDLDRPDDVAALLDRLEPIDILVSNAGVSVVERFVESDLSRWDMLWRVNLRAPMQLARGVLPGMLERRWGRLVFVSSDGARVGSGGEGVYSACKAGLLGLSRTLAREAARAGVTSNAVCPGPTDTPMLRRIAAQNAGLVEKLASQIPLGRLGQPADVAALVGFLCSDAAGYLTGQTLSVSGGITMS